MSLITLFFQWLADDPIRALYVGGIGMVLIFVLQLVLCYRAHKTAVKLIPLIVVIPFILLSLLMLLNVFDTTSHGLPDLHILVACILLVAVALAFVSIGIAWGCYAIAKSRKK